MDDEFDDFKIAPSIPQVTNNQYRPNITSSTTFGLKFDSPVHNGGMSKTLYHHPPPTTTFTRPPLPNVPGQYVGGKNNNKKQNAVGCRLANYDLNSSPSMNNQQQQQQSQPHHHHQQRQTITSVMQPFFVPNNSVINSSNSTKNPTATASTSNSSNVQGGDNLLGEEDKYSALRGLLVDQTNETIFSNTNSNNTTRTNPLNPHNSVSHIDDNGVEHKISLCDDVLQVVKTDTTTIDYSTSSSASSALDFGDFQSFSADNNSTNNYNSYDKFSSYSSPIPPTNNNNNNINTNTIMDTKNNSNFPSFPTNDFIPTSQSLFDLDSNFSLNNNSQQQPNIMTPLSSFASNESQGLQNYPTLTNIPTNTSVFIPNNIQLPSNSSTEQQQQQNAPSTSSFTNNDGDFGDFVSFNNNNTSGGNNFVNNATTTNNNIVIPASPKIILKSTDSYKKSTSTNSKSSKKPNQNSAPKISMNRIAKASNILKDSPTYPNNSNHNNNNNTSKLNDMNQISSIDDFDDFSYYQGNTTTTTTNMTTISSNKEQPQSLSSFDLLTSEGFDLSIPYCDNTTNTTTTTTMTGPLKTTLIGNNISLDMDENVDDDDEFGDFTTTITATIAENHDSITELAMKMSHNNLDLLPFNKPNKNLHCGAETQSLASLDLGNYVESEEIIKNKSENEEEEEVSPDSSEILGFDSYIKDDLTIDRNPDFLPSPIHADHHHFGASTEMSDQSVYPDDKYKCFKEEIEHERERYNAEWSRGLTACLHLITCAQNLLTSASSSEVVKEIIANEKGYAYMQNLTEVYIVACRIYSSSLKSIRGGTKVKRLFDEIIMAWESLTPFFIETPLMEKINSVEYLHGKTEEDGSSKGSACGVCLLGSEDYNSESDFIDYGGKIYHVNCANLWINNVDSLLPSY